MTVEKAVVSSTHNILSCGKAGRETWFTSFARPQQESSLTNIFVQVSLLTRKNHSSSPQRQTMSRQSGHRLQSSKVHTSTLAFKGAVWMFFDYYQHCGAMFLHVSRCFICIEVEQHVHKLNTNRLCDSHPAVGFIIFCWLRTDGSIAPINIAMSR